MLRFSQFRWADMLNPVKQSSRFPSQLRLVLDLDGVIVDTDEIKAETLAGLFTHLSAEVQSRIDAWNRNGRGVPRRDKFVHITATWDPDHASDEGVRHLLERYGDELAGARPSQLLPGAELLPLLSLPLHVASSAPRSSVVDELSRHGLLDCISTVEGDPPGKLETLRRIRAEHPTDTIVMIGDGAADLDAAMAAGVRFIGINRQPNSFAADVQSCGNLAEVLSQLGIE